MTFAHAIEEAIGKAMAEDPTVVIIGEDVHLIRVNLLARFGPSRVLAAPISEAAFVGASVTAAMAGLRPIVEVMLVDFIGVAMDAVLNHAAKVRAFSGGQWTVPLVIRAACGGGYGDGGQHMQSLWGWLAHIPGLTVVVPSTPADAAGLMLASIQSDDPVIYLEHKLLADYWLEFMGIGGRSNMQFDVPEEGAKGNVPKFMSEPPIGKAAIRSHGTDVSIVSVGVGVHQSLSAAEQLSEKGISCEVIDLRTVVPVDKDTVIQSVSKTGRLVVVDEDYRMFGLSGELAAIGLENGLHFKYKRVCTESTIPYAHNLEKQAIPNIERIKQSVLNFFDE